MLFPSPHAQGGAIVALEGLSGAGKTRAVTLLVKTMRKCNRNVRVVRWNSNDRIRTLIAHARRRDVLSPSFYSLLCWSACLLAYLRDVAPALRRGDLVLADRYIHTGVSRDKANGAWPVIRECFTRLLPAPDYVLYFALSPENALRSVVRRGSKPLFHFLGPTPLAPHEDRRHDLAHLRRLAAAYEEALSERRLLGRGRVVVLGRRINEPMPERVAGVALGRTLRSLNMDAYSYVRNLELSAAAGMSNAAFATTALTSPREPRASKLLRTESSARMKEIAMHEKIIAIVERYSKDASVTCTATTRLRDLGITSMNVVNIVSDLEEAFGVILDMGSIRREAFDSVETLKQLLEQGA